MVTAALLWSSAEKLPREPMKHLGGASHVLGFEIVAKIVEETQVNFIFSVIPDSGEHRLNIFARGLDSFFSFPYLF